MSAPTVHEPKRGQKGRADLDAAVHEPDLDAVVVEGAARLRDARDDQFGVVDARAAFLESCARPQQVSSEWRVSLSSGPGKKVPAVET